MGRAGGHWEALRPWLTLGMLAVASLCPACSQKAARAPQLDARARIAQLRNLLLLYVEKNRKGPANEESLREFGTKLTESERADHRIGNDLESIFASPRDNKKFIVQYNVRVDPSQDRAVAWEDTGVNGRRIVALSQGYVEEYDQQTFDSLKK